MSEDLMLEIQGSAQRMLGNYGNELAGRLENERRRLEQERLEAEERLAEKRRQAEKERLAEEERLAEVKRQAEKELQAEKERQAEKRRQARAEKERLARLAEQERQAEEERLRKELSAECRLFFERIQNLNRAAAAGSESLMKEVEAGTTLQRLDLILDDLELRYGREQALADRANWFRQELAEMLAAGQAGPESFQARLRSLLGTANLTEEDVVAARREFQGLAAGANSSRQELKEILAACQAGVHPESFRARLRALIGAADLTPNDVAAARLEFDDLAARANCFRKELAEMLAACEAGPESFRARLRALLVAADLTEKDVLAARSEFDDLAAQKAARAVLENISSQAGRILREMGYQVMDSAGLAPDRTQYLATPDQDCRIQCYINSQSGKMAFRQVRVVASQAEAAAPPTEYQKALDRDKGEKWCRAFDLMRERLNKAGHPIDIMLRREPGQGELPVVIDESLAGSGRLAAASAPRAREEKRS